LVRLAALLWLLVWAAPAAAQTCRLALVLAMDVSSSVDAGEDRLQRGGMASALIAPDVVAAFLSSPDPVALFIYEWSGRYNQQVLLDWTYIQSEADLLAASFTVANSTRSHNDFPTAMGYALGYAADQIAKGPRCLFATIDVAGDGENNDGFGPSDAYAAFPFAGVTVNGLVINGAEFEAETRLIDFYIAEVIRGPGAFVEIANGFADYETAMERKLVREVASQVLGRLE